MKTNTLSTIAFLTAATLFLAAAGVARAQPSLGQTDRMIIKFKGTSVTTTGVVVKSTTGGTLAHSRPRPMEEYNPAAPDTGGSSEDSAGGGTTGGGTTGGGTTVVTPQETVTAVAELAGRTGVALEVIRQAGGASVVIGLSGPAGMAEVRSLARRLNADPEIEYAVPDVRLEPKFSSDPKVSDLWNLTEPGTTYSGSTGPFVGSIGGMNAVKLWNTTQGQTQGGVLIRVAVIDTGSTSHPDIHDFSWTGRYDFIGADGAGAGTTFNSAGDGDGRDGNPNDPGDWCAASGANSSWHGTSVGGIIAATGANGQGIIGAAPRVELLNIRALGHCGGYLSDIVDAMRWSAGLPVPNVPANPTPARVLNLSLGTAWDYQCSTYEQSAINDIVAAGALLVAAAGNEGNTSGYPQSTGAMGAPANCVGVLAVGAHTRSGDLASYSNFDARVGLTAPGGGSCKAQLLGCQGEGITTLTNSGQQGQGVPQYRSNFAGTSAAAPHAAAAAALLFAVNPQAAPQDVVNSLKSAARAWPQGSFCAGGAGQGLCGAGMLDAYAAATHLSVSPIVQIAAPPSYLPGNASLDVVATATSSAYAPNQLTYQWIQLSGAPATLADDDKPTLRLTLPASRSTIKLQLRVTDPVGHFTDANAVVEVNNPPVPNPMTPVTVSVGEPISVQLGATDPDGDPIDFTLLQGLQGMTVNLQSGLLSWTPSGSGSGQVRVAVTDAYGATGQDIVFQVQASSGGESGGGGGGSIGGLGALGLLALLAVAARRRRNPEG